MPDLNSSLKKNHISDAKIQIQMPSFPFRVESEIFYDYPFLEMALSVQQAEHYAEDEEESAEYESIAADSGVHLVTSSHHKGQVTNVAEERLSALVAKTSNSGMIRFVVEDKMAFALMQEVRQLKKYKTMKLFMHVDFSFKVSAGQESSIKAATALTVPTI